MIQLTILSIDRVCRSQNFEGVLISTTYDSQNNLWATYFDILLFDSLYNGCHCKDKQTWWTCVFFWSSAKKIMYKQLKIVKVSEEFSGYPVKLKYSPSSHD